MLSCERGRTKGASSISSSSDSVTSSSINNTLEELAEKGHVRKTNQMKPQAQAGTATGPVAEAEAGAGAGVEDVEGDTTEDMND